MGLIFVPTYISFLGIESYAFVGIYTLLSSILGLFDAGLTPALSRAMARSKSEGQAPHEIRCLLRSVEMVVGSTCLVTAATIAICSTALAKASFTDSGISPDQASLAFSTMGALASIRFFEGIYRASLVGLQMQVSYNVINALFATVRSVGAIGVIAWLSPTITAFFLWQAIVSAASVGCFGLAVYCSLPYSGTRARFSLPALLNVRAFATGMLIVTFVSVCLGQADKAILFRLLPLRDYGFYIFASSMSTSIFLLVTPITQALYPRLCELQASHESIPFSSLFHKAAKLVTAVAGSVSIFLILFSDLVLSVWTRDEELTRQAAPLLSVLIAGNLVNGLLWIPNLAQYATGWTSLAFYTNFAALVAFIAGLLCIAPVYGAYGASWVWLCLNLSLFLANTHFMFKSILKTEKRAWLKNDVLFPLLSSIAVGTATRMAVDYFFQGQLQVIALFIGFSFVTLCTLCSVGLVTKSHSNLLSRFLRQFNR
jgi:O-antigen/teichoic acid export membrane protein